MTELRTEEKIKSESFKTRIDSMRRLKKIPNLNGMSGVVGPSSVLDYEIVSSEAVDLSTLKIWIKDKGYNRIFWGVDTNYLIDFVEITVANNRITIDKYDDLVSMFDPIVMSVDHTTSRVFDKNSENDEAQAYYEHNMVGYKCNDDLAVAHDIATLNSTLGTPDLKQKANYWNLAKYMNGWNWEKHLVSGANVQALSSTFVDEELVYGFQLSQVGLFKIKKFFPLRMFKQKMTLRIRINPKKNRFLQKIYEGALPGEPVAGGAAVVINGFNNGFNLIRGPAANALYDDTTFKKSEFVITDTFITLDEIIYPSSFWNDVENAISKDGLKLKFHQQRLVTQQQTNGGSNPTFVINEPRRFLNFVMWGRRNDATRENDALLTDPKYSFGKNNVFYPANMKSYQVKLNNVVLSDEQVYTRGEYGYGDQSPAYYEMARVVKFINGSNDLGVLHPKSHATSKALYGALFINDEPEDDDYFNDALISGIDNTMKTGQIVINTVGEGDPTNPNFYAVVDFCTVAHIKNNGDVVFIN